MTGDPAAAGTRPILVIAIDGPAASGKGTLARAVARRYGLPHLDTGLLYRAVGRRVLDAGADPHDPGAALAETLRLVHADLARPDLRGPDADRAASAVATHGVVREALVAFQRRFAEARGAVLDGRDIGTVIFPEAPVKLFVTASAEERARRRHAELRAAGIDADFATVLDEVRRRDAQDEGRVVAPLRPAQDAVRIDTTDLDEAGALAAAIEVIEALRTA